MKSIIAIFFLGTIIHDQASAQIQNAGDTIPVQISGTIQYKNGKPISSATVFLLWQDTSLFKTALSDSTGYFAFNNLPPATYSLKITGTGFVDTLIRGIKITGQFQKVSTGLIVLRQKEVTLAEVIVSAKKPGIERKTDRLTVNVSDEMALGNTAFELLPMVPGVIVKPDEQFALSGKSGVRIYINDRPSNLSQNELNGFLKSLNAADVKQIEVISNPSARYDAEGTGGIINIVLKKGYNRGLKVNLLNQSAQGAYFRNTSNISAGYSKGKFNVYGTYGLQSKKTFESNSISKNFTYQNTRSAFGENNFIRINSTDYFIRTGVDITINKKNTTGLLIQKNIYKEAIPQINNTIAFNALETVDSSFATTGESDNRRNDFSLNGNYQRKLDTLGSSLSADIDYSTFNITSFSGYNTAFFNSKGDRYGTFKQISDNPTKASIASAKIDLVKYLRNKVKLETGLKGSTVNNKSDVDFKVDKNGTFVADSSRTNSFDYKENTIAGYVSASGTFNKVGLQIGVRGEKTSTRGISQTTNKMNSKRYFNLFPSLSAGYTIVPNKHNLAFSYSRRIERPYYNDLNPFVYYTGPYTQLQGNPDLKPQYTNAFEVSYTLKNKYIFTLFHNATNGVMIQTPQQNDATRVTTLQVRNLEKSTQTGANLNLPLAITKWWEVNNNLLLYKKNFSSAVPSGVFNNSRLTLEYFLTNTFKLRKNYIAEVSGLYLSPFAQGIYKTQALYSLSASIKKSFLEKRLGVKFSVNDLLKSYKVNNKIQYQNQNTAISQRFDTQLFRLTVTYQFTKGKSISNRERKQGNLDEQNRIK